MNPLQEFQSGIAAIVNSSVQKGVHPAIIIATLEIVKSDIVAMIKRGPPDGPPPDDGIITPPGGPIITLPRAG